MGTYGSTCVDMDQYVVMWVHMGPYMSIWVHVGPYGTIWAHMGPNKSIWVHMGPYGSMARRRQARQAMAGWGGRGQQLPAVWTYVYR